MHLNTEYFTSVAAAKQLVDFDLFIWKQLLVVFMLIFGKILTEFYTGF